MKKLLLMLPALILLPLVFTTLYSAVYPKPAAAADACGSVAAPSLDAEQKADAAAIIATALAWQGLSPADAQRAAVIAIATSMQEGGLHNVHHGDAAGPDSLGVFQQRASWGPASVRLDPAGATKLFMARLVSIDRWQTRPLGDVAYDVQHFSDGLQYKYAANEAAAKAIVGTFTPLQACSSGPGTPGNPMGPECPKPPITQGFGPSSLPGEPAVFGFAHFHTGLDLACPADTPVRNIDAPGLAHVTGGCAAGDGKCGGGWGNHVVVEVHTDQGHFFVYYSHLASVNVTNGQQVKVGDLLGYEGSTGYSTGPHLHFEVDKDRDSRAAAIDPSGWLKL